MRPERRGLLSIVSKLPLGIGTVLQVEAVDVDVGAYLQVSHMCWNEWAIDQKVSDMTVAHTALRNALTPGFLLVVLTLVIAAFHLA